MDKSWVQRQKQSKAGILINITIGTISTIFLGDWWCCSGGNNESVLHHPFVHYPSTHQRVWTTRTPRKWASLGITIPVLGTEYIYIYIRMEPPIRSPWRAYGLRSFVQQEVFFFRTMAVPPRQQLAPNIARERSLCVGLTAQDVDRKSQVAVWWEKWCIIAQCGIMNTE